MILIDANLLLYAHSTTSEFHKPAKAWIERTFSNATPVGLPWTVLLEFLRISTSSRAMGTPLTGAQALQRVTGWLELPAVTVPEPTPRHLEVLSRIMLRSRVMGPTIADAHLAALTIEHGATLCTTDRDFRRFDSLRLMNPLEE